MFFTYFFLWIVRICQCRQNLFALSVKHVLLVCMALVFVFLSGLFFWWVKIFKILFFTILFYEKLENLSGRELLLAKSVKYVLLVCLTSVFVFLSVFFFLWWKHLKFRFLLNFGKFQCRKILLASLVKHVLRVCMTTVFAFLLCFCLGENT